jgi:REase_DpnII-MboI
MLSKIDAVAKIQLQINAIALLRQQPRFSPDFDKWQRDTEVAIEKIFGSETRHIKDFKSISYISPFGFSGISYSGDQNSFSGTPDSEDINRYLEGLEKAKSILQSMLEEVDEYGINSSEAQIESDKLRHIEKLCDRFHLVGHQLRNRHNNRTTLEIDDEYDVQDLLYALLLIEFTDIRSEEYTPSYAGGSSRVDFLLNNESIVIEVKKTRATLKAKELGDQLLIDIGRYQSHPKCQTLVCFVYDPEAKIANPRGIETDLSRKINELDVRVFIRPKGL